MTDKIIQWELYQNIGSSLVAMYLTVLVFLGSFRGAAFIIFCVAGTLVEVGLIGIRSLLLMEWS